MLLAQCAQLICLQGKKPWDKIFADALSDALGWNKKYRHSFGKWGKNIKKDSNM